MGPVGGCERTLCTPPGYRPEFNVICIVVNDKNDHPRAQKSILMKCMKGLGTKISKAFFLLTYRDFMPIFVHTRSFKATFTKRTRLFFAKKKTPEKGTGRVPRASFRSGWALLYLLPRPIIGSLSKDDAYNYGNASKQEYYWLKEEKYTCCTCNTNFRAFLCRTPQNNNVKSPNFRF